MKDIIQKHINNNYIVKIYKTKNIITVEVPENKVIGLPSIELKYKITNNGLIVNNNKLKRYNIPLYALPFAVVTDIALKIKDYNLSTNLFVIYKKNKIVSRISDLLPKLSEQDIIKQHAIANKYHDIVNHLMSEDDAIKLNIKEGYSAILCAISNGGL